MRILFLHNRYLIAGGEDVSTESEMDILREYGHQVDCLYADNANLKMQSKLSIALSTIWSTKYYRKVISMIEENNYDLLHVQNFFPQISPSIFYAAKKRGVKIVMSVRNYRLVCPNALLYVDNEICELCVGKTFPTPSLSRKCYKNDFMATAVTASMLSLHNILGTWSKKVDGFIAISEFVKNQLTKGGIPNNIIHVKHNFVNSPIDYNFVQEQNYLYVGRLSTEKGMEFLLKAFKSDQLKNCKLKIIGDGPMKELVLEAVASYPNISYLGKLPIQETYKQMAMCRALIFPSQWHEPFGRTIIEAFSCNTPVIASKVGGVTELVKDCINGFLYDPQNVDDLIAKIILIQNHPDIRSLKINARDSFDNNFTKIINYEQVMNIYKIIMEQ